MQTFSLGRALRKFFLSSFVIFTFVVYAVHERLTNPAAKIDPAAATPTASPTQQLVVALPQATPLPTDTAALPPVLPDTATPQSLNQGQYKDGTYTGQEVDAYYGWVQVQATVQGGRISQVEFLEYPHDRRTSQSINSIAMPYLQQEAIQVQSANVDIISGATLTSEAFARSLETALQSAHN